MQCYDISEIHSRVHCGAVYYCANIHLFYWGKIPPPPGIAHFSIIYKLGSSTVIIVYICLHRPLTIKIGRSDWIGGRLDGVDLDEAMFV